MDFRRYQLWFMALGTWGGLASLLCREALKAKFLGEYEVKERFCEA